MILTTSDSKANSVYMLRITGDPPLSRIGNNHRPHHEKGPRPAVRPATAEEP